MMDNPFGANLKLLQVYFHTLMQSLQYNTAKERLIIREWTITCNTWYDAFSQLYIN